MRRILIVLLPVSALLVFAGAASAQPYPGTPEPAANLPLDGGVQEPPPATVIAPTDSNYDSDPDIDGYDAEYDVHYDNVAAQGYDDGYNPNAYSYFESSLSPYGSWIDEPAYGRVWVPSSAYVGADFFPYATGGHWVLTDYGWTWVSDYNWGWGPFHYGRWTSIYGRGWCWIPGTVWGPAWVSWRSGGGYVGWSPLPPSGVKIGPPGGVRSNWRFTVANQLGSANPSYLPSRTVPSIFARTSVITNLRSVSVGSASVRVNAGPTLQAGVGLGKSLPVALRTVQPNALPQSHIAPRAGVPLSQRPWVQHPGTLDPYRRGPASIPIGPRPTYNPPAYNPPRTYSPPSSYAPRPAYNPPVHTYQPPSYSPPVRTYSPPSYSAPARTYPPSYNPPVHTYQPPSYSPPVHTYQPPSYSPPARTYSPPSYSAPARSYSPPAYHSAPSYSAPSYHAPSVAPSYSRPSYSAPMHSAPARGGFRR